MRLELGPVAPASAVAWLERADEILGEIRCESLSSESLPSMSPSTSVVGEVGHYLDRWMLSTDTIDEDESFQWHAEVHPDELEYLAQAFFSLDSRLSGGARRDLADGLDDGRDFYLVLVRALLHALETDSPGRAAFADQLRWSWPSAAQAI